MVKGLVWLMRMFGAAMQLKLLLRANAGVVGQRGRVGSVFNRTRSDSVVNRISPIVLAVLVFSGCNQPDERSDTGNLFEQLQKKAHVKRIAASSYPLMAMAEVIVGDEYEVWMPAKADAVPTTREMVKLQGSDVLLTNGPGAAYATWLPAVTLDRQKILETTTNSFELSDYIQVQEHKIVHSHGAEGEHSHFWMVPHCWLNPRLALLQAEEICGKLSEVYPEDAVTFGQNFAKLLESPLREAIAEAAVCQKRLEVNETIVLLNDPRLKHLATAVDIDAACLLWFEPEEVTAAKGQLQELIDQESNGQRAEEKHLLLWARSPGPDERELMLGMRWLQIDLIESPDMEKGFVSRVKDNFKRLGDAVESGVEMTVEVE